MAAQDAPWQCLSLADPLADCPLGEYSCHREWRRQVQVRLEDFLAPLPADALHLCSRVQVRPEDFLVPLGALWLLVEGPVCQTVYPVQFDPQRPAVAIATDVPYLNPGSALPAAVDGERRTC